VRKIINQKTTKRNVRKEGDETGLDQQNLKLLEAF
jgi:hypothetical protein